ncbi:hypothetical protein K5D33_07340 [Pseudomonas cichorii]|nr:DnaT-like ssDNA-binding protein [Pseudomonas cichorii]MBX8534537.1 hypothetical protein [Pseudomonas cichorii]
MALVIEDGSIVPGADSYATAAELAVYAANYGKTIPAEEMAQETLLRRAALEMEAIPWRGQATSSAQALAWPRGGVRRQNWDIPSNTIPPQIKAGQMALATEIHADDLAPPELKKGAVTREKVEGAVERQYAEASASISRPAAKRQSIAQFAGLQESGSQISLRRG